MTGTTRHVVLAAHGSRDPRAAVTVRAIARAVAVARPDVEVHDAYLDFAEPHLRDALRRLGGLPVIVVPLLLSAAYHARVDIPGVVDGARAAGTDVEIADVLGDPSDGGTDLMVAALRRRMRARRRIRPGRRFHDGIVLAAAGTRDAVALAGVDAVATALGAAEGVRCVAGYASGAGRPVGDAIGLLRASGSRSIALASYFLAPGLLRDRTIEHAGVAARAHAIPVRAGAPSLGSAPEVVQIISRRIDHCLARSKAFA